MSKIFESIDENIYENIENRHRCNCKGDRLENFLLGKKSKKQKSKKRRAKKQNQLAYPELGEITLKTFQMKYNRNLSSLAKFVLNSFQNKYIYYAIDDILYSFKSNPTERDNLLAILYSPILSLQNNFSINFFDIWVHEIHINEVSKVNKFLKNDSSNLEQLNYITIKLLYKTSTPIKKPDSLW
jgi:hypothetical protein